MTRLFKRVEVAYNCPIVANSDGAPTLDQLEHYLHSAGNAWPMLQFWQLRDVERGWRNLVHLGQSLNRSQLRELCQLLTRFLARCPDPDMALNNLERFLANPLAIPLLPTLAEARGRTLETLLLLFSTSHFFSDLLATNPDFLEMLRIPLRRSPSHGELLGQLQADLQLATEDAEGLAVFRRFRQRHILRIGTNDIIRDRPLEEITRDLTRVADVSVEMALRVAMQKVSRRFGQPWTKDGQPARCVVLAFGKQGGEELNYSSDIDLMFLFDEDGSTRGGSSIGNDEYYSRVATEVIRLLSANTERGQAYRVDLRLRPEGTRGPLARSLGSTLSYYDTLGRTWERQALIKVRPVAGDLALGVRFLQSIESFVYRKYLTFAEINEIKSVKRLIENKTSQEGVSAREVKTGRGGIRDIEFTIQFLQLLNGVDLVELRQRNTLLALVALERVGCLTDQEYRVLDDAYRFLRKTEHRLQLLFDLQTHQLPEKPEELTRLALRMGYFPAAMPQSRNDRRRTRADDLPVGVQAWTSFQADYIEKTEPTRHILEHLLHQTFADEGVQAEPESDLILDPNPDQQTIQNVLGKYPFRDVNSAYQNLTKLAQEEVVFLSTRRCRHFLASIAPALLRYLAETPEPDQALNNLEKVTRSLGAKTVLWELFSFNPPSLKLYVDLCSSSQFLSEILINNPGMIDELLDSLVLNQPRSLEELQMELADLCRGADDLEPILHSFQDKEYLRIGVRDILGKDTLQETTEELSDLGESILTQILEQQLRLLQARFGIPLLAEGPRARQPSRFVILGLGKLGGREMTYHSDLDLIFIYEGDGRTSPEPVNRTDAIDNFQFYTALCQQMIKSASFQGPMGRLYQIDMRLRPTGKSGNLVLPLGGFRQYFQHFQEPGNPKRSAQIWERQILTRARIVYGDFDFGQEVMTAVHQAMLLPRWSNAVVEEIRSMREKLVDSRSRHDLKRCPGGLMDVEFLVETFQLKYGPNCPSLRQTNLWKALDSLHNLGFLSRAQKQLLEEGYNFLLRLQSRLRIIFNRTIDQLPEKEEEINKLARRLGFDSGLALLKTRNDYTFKIRNLYTELLDQECQSNARGFSPQES